LEDGIASDGIQEDVLRDLVTKRGRDHLHERIQFFLRVQVPVGAHHELADVLLDHRRQLHVAHGGVGHVELLLELLRAPVEGGDHEGDGSEDVGDDESASY